VQHVSDLHPKFALRPHHVWKYGRHPICDGRDYARKKNKDRRRNHRAKKVMAYQTVDSRHKVMHIESNSHSVSALYYDYEYDRFMAQIWDYPGEPVPKGKCFFWILWCKVRYQRQMH